MMFLLNQLTLEMRKKLVLLLNYREHKLPNKPSLMDPTSVKESSLDFQTDTYNGDSMGEIKDYLAPGDKDKKLNNVWSKILKKTAA